MQQPLILFTALFIAVLMLLVLVIFLRYFRLWLKGFLTRANISLVNLVAMSMRRTDPAVILDHKIMAVQAGLTEQDGITTAALESHYLAGGNLTAVIHSLIAARKQGEALSFEDAAARDLSGVSLHGTMLIGRQGRSEDRIPHAGTVRIEGQHFSAISEEGEIDSDYPIEVVAIAGEFLIVRRK